MLSRTDNNVLPSLASFVTHLLGSTLYPRNVNNMLHQLNLSLYIHGCSQDQLTLPYVCSRIIFKVNCGLRPPVTRVTLLFVTGIKISIQFFFFFKILGAGPVCHENQTCRPLFFYSLAIMVPRPKDSRPRPEIFLGGGWNLGYEPLDGDKHVHRSLLDLIEKGPKDPIRETVLITGPVRLIRVPPTLRAS